MEGFGEGADGPCGTLRTGPPVEPPTPGERDDRTSSAEAARERRDLPTRTNGHARVPRRPIFEATARARPVRTIRHPTISHRAHGSDPARVGAADGHRVRTKCLVKIGGAGARSQAPCLPQYRTISGGSPTALRGRGGSLGGVVARWGTPSTAFGYGYQPTRTVPFRTLLDGSHVAAYLWFRGCDPHHLGASDCW